MRQLFKNYFRVSYDNTKYEGVILFETEHAIIKRFKVDEFSPEPNLPAVTAKIKKMIEIDFHNGLIEGEVCEIPITGKEDFNDFIYIGV